MNTHARLLLHWEALYPFDTIKEGLNSFSLPESFPKESFYMALPHDYLVQATASFNDSGFHFGASYMLDTQEDSFTGSIAAKFLTKSKATFVLIGKAFDRHQLKESPGLINHKVQTALAAKITPFVCFGETQEEFENEQREEVIKNQLTEYLASITPEELETLSLIYDTPFALTTVSTVTSERLFKLNEMVRKVLSDLYGDEVTGKIKLLCALEPYKPLTKEQFENSPFAGFYFRMIDANLSIFTDAAEQIAPFLSGSPAKADQIREERSELTQDSSATSEETTKTDPSVPLIHENEDLDQTVLETEDATPSTLSPNVPALAPTQHLLVTKEEAASEPSKKETPPSPEPPPEKKVPRPRKKPEDHEDGSE